ncbi:site-specific integrase [Endozoicomonas sp.]|uniref:site-specific integrase n=1 Tax=Endozoicomonas sp. TaxID=1892382 RepID=UPI00383A9AD6
MDGNKMPLPYPNLFLTVEFRNASSSPNNCHNVLERIKYLYEICDFLGIDIERRCLEKEFLTKDELQTIIRWSGRKVESFREHITKVKSKKVVSLQPKRNKLETARAVIITDDKGDSAPSTAYNRITTYAKYIGWLEQKCYPDSKGDSERFMLGMRPVKAGSTNSIYDWESGEVYGSITSSQCIRVLDVMRHDSTENPWKNKGVRYRNQLMVNIFEALGIRRGELARIYVNDFKQTPKGLHVLRIRKSVDLADTRKNRPKAKAKGRILPVDSRLAEMINNYIIEYRSEVNGAEKIPQLFITHNHREKKNRALSLDAINKVFREVSTVVGFSVHPHAFRHYWNDQFSQRADRLIAEGKTTPAKVESDRQKLMGWDVDSRMAKWYAF